MEYSQALFPFGNRNGDIGSIADNSRVDAILHQPALMPGSSILIGSTRRNVEICREGYERLISNEQTTTSLRESFVLVKEAAIKAMAAVELCSQSKHKIEPHFSHICLSMQLEFERSSFLIEKHGHVKNLKKYFPQNRGKESCFKTISKLETIADDAWDLLEDGTNYKRNRLRSPGTRSVSRDLSHTFRSSFMQHLKPNSSANIFLDNLHPIFVVSYCCGCPAGPKSLRFMLVPKRVFRSANEKLRCLLYSSHISSQYSDCGHVCGTIWWASGRRLLTYDTTNGITTQLSSKMMGSPVLCMTCDCHQRIWTGHSKGEIKCWTQCSVRVLSEHKCSTAIRCLLVDCGLVVWAGMSTGKLARLRCYTEDDELHIEMMGFVVWNMRTQSGLMDTIKRVYGMERDELVHSGRVRCMLAKDNFVWSSGGDQKKNSSLQLWDLFGGEVCGASLAAFGICDAMIDLPWESRDAKERIDRWRLVTGHETGELVLWIPKTLEPMVKIGPTRSPVRAIFNHKSLGLLLAAHQDGSIVFRKELSNDLDLPGMSTSNDTLKLKSQSHEELHDHLPHFGEFCAHRKGLSAAITAADSVYTAGVKGAVSCWPISILEREAIKAGIQVQVPKEESKNLRRDITLRWLNRTAPPASSFKEFNAPLSVRDVSSSGDEDPLVSGSGILESNPSLTEASDSEAVGQVPRLNSDSQTWSLEEASQEAESPVQKNDEAAIDLCAGNLEAPTAKLFSRASVRDEAVKDVIVPTVAADLRVEQSIISANDLQFEENPQNSLGSGAFGVVYKGKAYMLDAAIKVLKGGTLMHKSNMTRFNMDDSLDEDVNGKANTLSTKEMKRLAHEASLMFKLRHPHIVMFLGVCLKPPALVTEYCAKGSLFALLHQAESNPNEAKMLTWKRILTMAFEASLGMHYLHTRLIEHRDLKSPNLLVDEHLKVRVGDFGTSKFMESEQYWSESLHASNPLWLAPESLKDGKYGFKADVYSFGIVLWELLTWKVPWASYCGERARHPMQVYKWAVEGQRPKIPENEELPAGPCPVFNEYVNLMEGCWAQDPDVRPEFQFIANRLETMLAKVQKPETSFRKRLTTKNPDYVVGAPTQMPPLSPFVSPRRRSTDSTPRTPGTRVPLRSPFEVVRQTNGSSVSRRSSLSPPPPPPPPPCSPFLAKEGQKMSGRLAERPSAAFQDEEPLPECPVCEFLSTQTVDVDMDLQQNQSECPESDEDGSKG